MPISMPWASRAALFAGLAVATAALAQDSAKDPARPGARDRIDAQGHRALDRLESALSQAKDERSAADQPRLPAPAPEATSRRAFDALHRRHVDPALDKRARAAVAAGEAALARQREDQARRLRQALGLEPAESDALAGAIPQKAATSWVPLLFVSASMPLATLRSYASQLERVRGVLAFRGMPFGLRKVGPMARLSAQILRLDPGCEGPGCSMRNVQLIVDPIVFRQHGVTRVPALAMLPGDPAQAYCERDDESPRAGHLVFGDSALPGLLEEYARLGGAMEVKDAQALLAPR
jgi:hypothetical protein